MTKVRRVDTASVASCFPDDTLAQALAKVIDEDVDGKPTGFKLVGKVRDNRILFLCSLCGIPPLFLSGRSVPQLIDIPTRPLGDERRRNGETSVEVQWPRSGGEDGNENFSGQNHRCIASEG